MTHVLGFEYDSIISAWLQGWATPPSVFSAASVEYGLEVFDSNAYVLTQQWRQGCPFYTAVSVSASCPMEAIKDIDQVAACASRPRAS